MRVRRPRQRYDLVEIIWDDAASLPQGWESDKPKPVPQLALAVGFVLAETKEHIVLALNIDGDGQHNDRSQIPRGMVKNIKILRKRDSEPTAR